MARLSRARVHDERVHARGVRHRPQVVGRVRAVVLQVRQPDQVVQAQEGAENRAVVQQVRESERVAYLATQEALLQSGRKVRLIIIISTFLVFTLD